MRVDEFWRVNLETSHSKLGRFESNVRVSSSGGVRDREKDTRDGSWAEDESLN